MKVTEIINKIPNIADFAKIFTTVINSVTDDDITTALSFTIAKKKG